MEIRFTRASTSVIDELLGYLKDLGHAVEKERLDHDYFAIRADGCRLVEQNDSEIVLTVTGTPVGAERSAFTWLDGRFLLPAPRRDDWFYALCAYGMWSAFRVPSLTDVAYEESAGLVLLILNIVSSLLFVSAYLGTFRGASRSSVITSPQSSKLFIGGALAVAASLAIGLGYFVRFQEQYDSSFVAAVSAMPMLGLCIAWVAFHRRNRSALIAHLKVAAE